MAKTKDKEADGFSKIEKSLKAVLRGDTETALDIAGDFVRAYPNRPEGYFALGMVAYRQGDSGRALDLFNNAHSLDPECRDYADALAVLYTLNGKLTEGLYFAKLATALEPNPRLQPLLPPHMSHYFNALASTHLSVHYIRAMAAFNARDFADAAEECERELRINKTHAEACRLLAKASNELSNYARADEASKAAVALAPESAETFTVLGETLTHLGEFSRAIEAHRVALDRDTDSVDVATAAVNGTRFMDDDSISVQSDFSTEVERRVSALPTDDDQGLVRASPPDGGMIRVGYLSNSLFDSDLGQRVRTLLSFHNRRKFEVYVYQSSISRDSVTVEISARATSYRSVYDLDDDVAATIIRNDGIDVLVDLCGYSDGNRLGIVARKPAPAQIGFLQYPYGFKVPGVNFILSDPVTAATDGTLIGKGQDCLMLGYGLVAVLPFSAMQDVRPLPARKKGYVTFGGIAEPAYLSADTVDAWAMTIKSTPKARLLLGMTAMVSPVVRARVNGLFAAHGVADRIDFHEPPTPRQDRQAFYHRIDVLLDTYPVSGEFSLCESLWMGVPVVSLMGSRRSSQMGASILHAAGRPQWACRTARDFADTAGALASDVGALADTRASLRDIVAQGALFNPGVLMASLEVAFIEARSRVRGEKS